MGFLPSIQFDNDAVRQVDDIVKLRQSSLVNVARRAFERKLP